MKRLRSACRLAGSTAFLLLAAGCSSDRASVQNLAACSVPRVETTGWVRRLGPYHGFSYRLPASFRRDTAGLFIHGGMSWRDGPREFHTANGYWGPSSVRGRYSDRPSDPGHSECWDTIGGLRVLISTHVQDGLYEAGSWFLDPQPSEGFRGMEVVLAGHGTSRQDQELLLAISAPSRLIPSAERHAARSFSSGGAPAILLALRAARP